MNAPGGELLPRWQVDQEDPEIEFRLRGSDQKDEGCGIGEPRKIGADHGSDRPAAHSSLRR